MSLGSALFPFIDELRWWASKASWMRQSFPLLSAKLKVSFFPALCFQREGGGSEHLWKIQDLHIFKKTICLWSTHSLPPSPANASFEWPLDFRKDIWGVHFLSWITYDTQKKRKSPFKEEGSRLWTVAPSSVSGSGSSSFSHQAAPLCPPRR